MDRRDFLLAAGAATVTAWMPASAFAAPAGRYERLLVLVELKGGNDALNTVVPYADAQYYALRPRIAIKRDEVAQLDARVGLHPSLAPLMPLWQGKELAVLQNVGYPNPNLSHFRSIEIWDTASASEQFLAEGWLARAFAAFPPPRQFAADGVLVSAQDFGPLAGASASVRALSLANTEQFARQAKLAQPAGHAGNAALAHILKVEADVAQAANRLRGGATLRTEFPKSEFGNAVKTACEVVAGGAGVAVLHLSLGGFDTHQNQPGTQANLLKQLAEGLLALRAGLTELKRWDNTLVMTYAEFGRRARENQSNGTDHGTASTHFALGGAVRGGLYGEPPNLVQLDGNGNLAFGTDFRALYATILERWWNLPSADVLGKRFAPVDFIRA